MEISQTQPNHISKNVIRFELIWNHFLLKIFLYAHYVGVDFKYEYKRTYLKSLMNGGGGIRTHGALADTLVFKTRALNHSTTPPGKKY